MADYEQSSLPDWYQGWQMGLGATEEQYRTTSEHVAQGHMICSPNLWGWDIRKAPPTSSQSLLLHIHSWSYNYHTSKKTSHGSPWLPEIQWLPNPDPALSEVSQFPTLSFQSVPLASGSWSIWRLHLPSAPAGAFSLVWGLPSALTFCRSSPPYQLSISEALPAPHRQTYWSLPPVLPSVEFTSLLEHVHSCLGWQLAGSLCIPLPPHSPALRQRLCLIPFHNPFTWFPIGHRESSPSMLELEIG